MPNENEVERSDLTSPHRPLDELTVLSSVVSALAPLDPAVRLRLFRTLMTFFDIPLEQSGTSVPSASRPTTNDSFSTFRPTSATSPTFSEDRTPTPKAFLLEKRPQTDVERIACLAYYLTHYKNQPHFKTLELSKLNTEAAQVKFSNPAKSVDNATQAHLLIQAGQGKKQISAIGELYVQALPDRVAAKQAAAEVRQRRTRTKSRNARSNVSQEAPDSEEPFDGNGS